MSTQFRRRARAGALLAFALFSSTGALAAPDDAGGALTTPNASGWLRTHTASGTLDTANPFFQSLGSNGRSCNTCHQLQDAWSLTTATVHARFDASGGNDPLFRSNDGATSPLAD